MILISERNGSAMWVRWVEVQEGRSGIAIEGTGVTEVKQGLLKEFYLVTQIPVQLFFADSWRMLTQRA